MWQESFEKYRDQGFTVVGVALDAEGITTAKHYYEKYGVTFPSLVDPNYATGFRFVPKTFFVDELGVVQSRKDWEKRLKPADQLRPVDDSIRNQWTAPGQRLSPAAVADLVTRHHAQPADLQIAVELASRYLAANLTAEARAVVNRTLKHLDPLAVARSGDSEKCRLLGHAYFQLSRASAGDRDAEVKYATLSFYLNPSIGLGKQIARIIAPDKFDNRPGGDFDHDFREATLRRLQRERKAWLAAD